MSDKTQPIQFVAVRTGGQANLQARLRTIALADLDPDRL